MLLVRLNHCSEIGLRFRCRLADQAELQKEIKLTSGRTAGTDSPRQEVFRVPPLPRRRRIHLGSRLPGALLLIDRRATGLLQRLRRDKSLRSGGLSLASPQPDWNRSTSGMSGPFPPGMYSAISSKR
jgi:hypothetical protein